MPHESRTPSIQVSIGRQARLYHACVTTAPTRLDGPSTLTLYAASWSDVAGFAADPPAMDGRVPDEQGRLVLIDTTEFAWQRARCRSGAHILAPADPMLVGLTTLQHWLWQRLYAPISCEVHT